MDDWPRQERKVILVFARTRFFGRRTEWFASPIPLDVFLQKTYLAKTPAQATEQRGVDSIRRRGERIVNHLTGASSFDQTGVP